jgi:hypothetical protein
LWCISKHKCFKNLFAMGHFDWPISKNILKLCPLPPQNKSDTFLHHFLLSCKIVYVSNHVKHVSLKQYTHIWFSVSPKPYTCSTLVECKFLDQMSSLWVVLSIVLSYDVRSINWVVLCRDATSTIWRSNQLHLVVIWPPSGFFFMSKTKIQ